jgi:hypothetical protein
MATVKNCRYSNITKDWVIRALLPKLHFDEKHGSGSTTKERVGEL